MDVTLDETLEEQPDRGSQEPTGSPAMVDGDAVDSGAVGGPVSEPHGRIPVLAWDNRSKWKSFRSVDPNGGKGESDLDVFIDPDGHWWRKVRNDEVAELVVPMKTKGLRPIGLVNIDHWRPTE